MKKLLLTIALIAGFNMSAQWITSEKNDPFDGKRTSIIATGYGGSFPYNDPSLIFRDTEGELEVYITGAGSLACDEAKIQFSFGDKNNIKTFYLDESINGNAGFFRFTDVELYNFVLNLKQKSIVYVRFITRCSQNEFKISLKGSTEALNIIFNSKWNDKVKAANAEEREKQAKIKNRKQNVKDLIPNASQSVQIEVTEFLIYKYYSKIVKEIRLIQNKIHENYWDVHFIFEDETGGAIPYPISKN